MLTGGHARDRQGPVLRADRARRRRPLDGGDDRGDVRPDAADHEGAPTPRRRSGSPTTRPTASPASVWTKDARARRGRSRAGSRPGAVCVNDAQINYLALELPMGGWKTSGMGRATARGGIRKYCASAVAAGHAARAQARPAHVPVQGAHDRDASAEGHQAAVRARQAGLALLAIALGLSSSLCWGLGRLLRRPPEPALRGARRAARRAGASALALRDPVRARGRRRGPQPAARSAGPRWRARRASSPCGASTARSRSAR